MLIATLEDAMKTAAKKHFGQDRAREALSILEDFDRIYVPVKDELEMMVNKNMEASEYYTVLLDIQKKNEGAVEKSGTDVILERVLKLALTDKDLKKTNDSILDRKS